ncbi:MAG: hypothetical protein M1823_006073 [Watsoniomyces obsoletus]|nr:MAG: hypothetical protein M1823_006073 [Watsoniomyces obsoletus]
MALAIAMDPPNTSNAFDETKTDDNTMRRRWQRFSEWLNGRKGPSSLDHENDVHSRPGIVRRWSKRVITELPRPGTFKRQLSERRERLMVVDPGMMEHRAVSMDRQQTPSSRRIMDSIPPLTPPLSTICASDAETLLPSDTTKHESLPPETYYDNDDDLYDHHQQSPPPFPSPSPLSPLSDTISASNSSIILSSSELDTHWILNLSMSFRDRSSREKFFITYRDPFQPPHHHSRRLTISLDYRSTIPDSLEHDLLGIRYARDKSARIYEAIRDSLLDIEFFDTVTNLKLQTTSDGRLHVHVTEDINEIIPYPDLSVVEHLGLDVYEEQDLVFKEHVSGFVYRMELTPRGERVIDGGELVDDDEKRTMMMKTVIKKEIPTPDAIDEFMYELIALHTLREAPNVISLIGLVVDDDRNNGRCSKIKGLLLEYCPHGNLGDVLYSAAAGQGSSNSGSSSRRGNGIGGRRRGGTTTTIPWRRREKWARQIIRGIQAVHEAGFVQGDVTLSNIVLDGNDDVRIIDLNRRGVPLGWESPEMLRVMGGGSSGGGERGGEVVEGEGDAVAAPVTVKAEAAEVEVPGEDAGIESAPVSAVSAVSAPAPTAGPSPVTATVEVLPVPAKAASDSATPPTATQASTTEATPLSATTEAEASPLSAPVSTETPRNYQETAAPREEVQPQLDRNNNTNDSSNYQNGHGIQKRRKEIISPGIISMMIGVKSDLYQLGMVLWSIMTGDDEPQLQRRPLMVNMSGIGRGGDEDGGQDGGDGEDGEDGGDVEQGDGEEDEGDEYKVPEWFREVVRICLDEDPRGRKMAGELLGMFPLAGD